MPPYRSHRTTQGRTQMAARALWRATGTAEVDLVKPIVTIANSYTQFVPGHVHLKPLGDLVAQEIYKAGGGQNPGPSSPSKVAPRAARLRDARAERLARGGARSIARGVTDQR